MQEAEAIAAASAQHLANGTAEQLSSGPIVGLLPASQAAGLGTSNTSQGVRPEAVSTPNANGLSGSLAVSTLQTFMMLSSRLAMAQGA